jgi:uncharacterized protein
MLAKMSRPTKCRRIESMPGVTYFKPAGIPLRILEEIRLTLEEAEAVRLKDLEDLDQEQSAKKMNISRPTFQRILESARKKIADALLNGKAIKIEGGNCEIADLQFQCRHGHSWNLETGNVQNLTERKCPVCKALAVNSPASGIMKTAINLVNEESSNK